LGSLGIQKQVAKLLSSLGHHPVRHDQPMTVLRVTLKTQQANVPVFGERNRLTEIEQSVWLIHMGQKDSLEALAVSPACSVAATLRRAEAA
jgi:hypothetical protein